MTAKDTAALVLAGAMMLGATASLTALANEGYGYDAESPADCSAEYPIYEVFEDGSRGCFRVDTPGYDEWDAGEWERAMLNDPDYDREALLRDFGVTLDEAIELGWIDAPATTIAPYIEPVTRPSLPRTGN